MPTARQLRAEETRQKIIEVGRRLLNEKGYASVTVDEIVAECGVAKGTFYHHFPSKEDFFASLEYAPYVELDASMLEDNRRASEVFRSYVKKFVELVHTYSPHYLSSWAGHLSEAKPLAESTDANAELTYALNRLSVLEALLLRDVTRGILTSGCPVHELATFTVTQLYGYIVWYCMAGDEVSSIINADVCADLIASRIESYRVGASS